MYQELSVAEVTFETVTRPMFPSASRATLTSSSEANALMAEVSSCGLTVSSYWSLNVPLRGGVP